METPREKISYCIGLEAGKGIISQFADLDLDLLVKGFQDAIFNAPLQLEMDEIRAALTTLRTQMQEQQKAFVQKMAEDNKKTGEEFLTQNKSKDGVITLASGLQYKVLKAGSGKSPTLFDVVSTHYKGYFIDGKVFDSSYDRNTPQLFPVNRVIPAWSEALQLMKEGDKWQIFAPAYLAYGEHGFQNQIPPNATLVFDMELLQVNPPTDQ